METRYYIDLLNGLSDVDSVRQFLVMMGANGFRQDETSCPISNYLNNMTGHMIVTGDTIEVYTDWDSVEEEKLEFETSEAIKQFITKFDLGHYPELDADSDNYSD